MKQRTKSLAYTALLLALGLALPRALHVFGQNAGQMFLPLHLPVLVAGLALGAVPGAVLGAVLPPLSFAFSGMPPPPLLWFMTAELLVYGLTAGLYYKKLRPPHTVRLPLWAALPLAQVSGRAAEALLLLLGGLFHLNVPPAMTVVTAVAAGLPGIAAQWALAPLLVKALDKISREKT
ncbi:MAG: ECF transporter S component [Oscillospiraceae bacterium]|jgi:niacin transporter|nr:ECF transporter S component [Oscillospiraceae bacterium]